MKKNIRSLTAVLLLPATLLLSKAVGIAKTDPPEAAKTITESIVATVAEPYPAPQAVPTETEPITAAPAPETEPVELTEEITAAEISEENAPQQKTEAEEQTTLGPVLELLRDVASHTEELDEPPEVLALRDEIESSDDPFSHADPNLPVLLDHGSALRPGTQFISHGYIFTLSEIADGKAIVSEVVGGSLAKGFLVRENAVYEKKFAVIELRRQDGATLSDTEKTMWFFPHRLIGGFEPWITSMCLMAEPHLYHLTYTEETAVYYLIDLSDMLIFADHPLALALTESGIDLGKRNFYADRNGIFAFHESAFSSPHALFYLDIPAVCADPSAAETYAAAHCFSSNFNGYTPG